MIVESNVWSFNVICCFEVVVVEFGIDVLGNVVSVVANACEIAKQDVDVVFACSGRSARGGSVR